MNDEDNQPKSRNVTAGDIAAILVVLGLLLPLFWFRESGKTWALALIALIPIIGLIYWLRLPARKRAEAEDNAKAELDKRSLGRGFKHLIWGVYVLAAAVIVTALAEWMQRT